MRLFYTLRKLKNPRVCNLQIRHDILLVILNNFASKNFIKKLTMGGLEGLKQEQVRALIGKLYIENWMNGKVYIIKHFKAINIPKSTIYRVLQRFEEGTGSKRKCSSGRPAIKMTPTKKRMLIKEATHKVGATQLKLAKKYYISVAMVNNILQEEPDQVFKLN